MPSIVGVRFKPVGKIYYFSPKDYEFQVGDGVIVETSRGVEYGKVVIANKTVTDKEIVQPLKEIKRKATEKDEKKVQKNLERRPEAIRLVEEKVKEHKLKMKLIDAEFAFDGSKVIFYFTAEGRVDFRELVKDIAAIFKIRIELRQVGIRDESKLLGGLGPCGRPCCCAQHLGDFERVSIKMAKVQGLSLNPTKISGLCGRLMCCLSYENEHYTETSKVMPKVESIIKTPDGEGMVINNDLIKRVVTVRFKGSDGTVKIQSYPLKDVNVKETMYSALEDTDER